MNEQKTRKVEERKVFEAPRVERAGDLPVITAGSVDLHIANSD